MAVGQPRPYMNTAAFLGADRTTMRYALQRRHPNGKHWVDVGHFPTRHTAKLALEAFVVHGGHGEESDFRVKRIPFSERDEA